MKKILWLLVMQCIAMVGYAQQLKGKVTESLTGKPVPNVNITVTKLNRNVITNQEGFFELNLPAGSHELEFSCIGYQKLKKLIVIPLQGSLLIELNPMVNELTEVVVNTGYQKIAKERATGSFSYISKETFIEQIATDVLSRLEVITPSLTVDRRTAGASIMIRGLSTLTGDRNPLIILDDFPYAGDLKNINPNDIENITVLKDAAAASIWGAKAGNGVIVITTKKGTFNQQMNVNFNASTSLINQPTLKEYNNVSGAEMVQIEQMLFAKGFYTSQENSTSKVPLSPVVELLIAARDLKINQATLQNQLALLQEQDIKQNYKQSFYSSALNQQYNMSLNGGSSNASYYLLLGYDKNKDALAATFNRFNLKADQTFKLNTKLDLGYAILITNSNSKTGRTSFNSLTTNNGSLPPYTQFVDEEGNALPVMKTYRTLYTNGLGGGSLLDWNYYALNDGLSSTNAVKNLDLLANFKLNYTILKGLRLSLNYQYEKQDINGTTNHSLTSYYARNLINLYTQIVGATVTRPVPMGAIRNENKSQLAVNNLRTQLNFDQQWTDFSLNMLAGVEARDINTKDNNTNNYGVDESTLTTTAVDYANAYKSIINGANLFIPYGNNYNAERSRYVSVFTNGAINYANKYTLSASARRDASNLFGVATNKLWNPLWSIGGAWLLSNEKFLQTKFLPYARLRVTYGSSGNSDSKKAAVTTINYSAVNPYTKMQYAGFTNYANPDLKWETVNTFNLGADLKWFNNRLNASFEYYVKKSIDLIGTEPIDYTGGIGFQVSRNAAKISARGFDAEISSLNVDRAIKWTTSLFVNFYKDRVDKYYLSTTQASSFVNGNTVISGIQGSAVYGVYAYKWAGLNPMNGNPRGYVNGVISEDYATIVGAKTTQADLTYMGTAFPKITGAIGNGIKWNGFNLDFRVSFKLGYYFRRPGLDYSALYNNRKGNAEYAQRWQNTGDELITNVPSLIYPAVSSRDSFYNFSETTVVKGDHIRLQYIGLGYQFNKSNFKGLPFKNITLRTIANNIGILWRANKMQLDPDYPGEMPNRNYSFNIQINL